MSDNPLIPDKVIIKQALSGRCPGCNKGALFKGGLFSTDVNDKCAECGLAVGKNDSADGPAVFLIFVLGFVLVPMAIMLEVIAQPPLWVHAILWSILSVAISLLSLRPLKAYIIALQYKYRPEDLED